MQHLLSYDDCIKKFMEFGAKMCLLNESQYIFLFNKQEREYENV